RLIVELHVTRYHRASRPVEIEFVAPPDQDAQEAARLRRLGNSPTDTGTWSPFLEKNWNTVKPGALSPEAQRQLALHLFLHRAIYAPEPLVKLDVAPLRATASPIWKPEAAVLEFEIRAARDHAAAERALAPAMRTEYPTMRYRVEEVLRGEGFLTTYRHAYGAEREF